jgi:1-acyl-sn-glycerol-3-phosphate acyltransferase
MDLGETGGEGGLRSGFTWLRTGIVGGLLWMRWWTFGFWRREMSELVNIRLLLGDALIACNHEFTWLLRILGSLHIPECLMLRILFSDVS